MYRLQDQKSFLDGRKDCLEKSLIKNGLISSPSSSSVRIAYTVDMIRAAIFCMLGLVFVKLCVVLIETFLDVQN